MDLQLGLYLNASGKQNPDVCRNYHHGNENSEAANDSIQSSKKQIKRNILEYIRSSGDTGATCDEIEFALGLSHQCCSARCTELKKSNKVYVDGKRLTRSRCSAAVLKAAE